MTPVAPAVRPLSPWASAVLLASVVAGLLILIDRDSVASAVLFLPYAGIGAYLVTRRPANVIGWLLMLMGWSLALTTSRHTVPVETLLTGRLDTVDALTVWSGSCAWTLAFFGIFAIALVFPSGRLPMGRGRWLAWVGLAVALTIVALVAFGPTIYFSRATTETLRTVPNPLAILPDAQIWSLIPHLNTLYAVMVGLFVTSLVGLGLRYRDSTGFERLQYRWLVAAIALVAIATAVWAFSTLVLQLGIGVAGFVAQIAYPAIPIAIAVAILRYRLYEIDRIISRTIAYAIVSVTLIGVFGVVVVLLSTVLSSFAAGQSLAVAGSALIAYAVAQPVLGRVRKAVDRRFDRARYDQERILATFTVRLRDEIDVDAITRDLATTARSAVAPTSVFLWVRPGHSSR
jgi:hypothetical protein